MPDSPSPAARPHAKYERLIEMILKLGVRRGTM